MASSKLNANERRKSSVSSDRRSSVHMQPNSIMAALAAKKAASTLLGRIKDRRSTTVKEQPHLEPTYKLKPDKKILYNQIKHIVDNVLKTIFDNFDYDSKRAKMICPVISQEIQRELKQLCVERYKFVCQVFIGENKKQSIQLGSRCTWDVTTDNSASGCYQTATAFCCATVFAVYCE
ncbi:DgyrCDS12816 [Dimorphilus gyrociliatus]|uniref:DgyrCDS12816 n=1 Tax=Dimorphilus gyrociliatus TaxID=2664684 RepID=A0A7I8W8U8_9ANNE|nr:DgyrCDS12816 [Dimorphilus gyrociliatus]